MSFLEVKKLSYRLKLKNILNNVSFDLKLGDYLGVIGPNGAGKSTLIKILLQYLHQTEGTIFIENENIETWSVRKMAQNISYVPQIVEWTALRGLTVKEILETATLLHPVSEKEKEKILNLLHLQNQKNSFIETLSGGERQKVLLASALLQDTKILLLDEAFSFLDIKRQIELETVIQSLLKKKKIIISVFHSVQFLRTYQKILALKEGKLFFLGTTEQYIKEETSRGLFGLPFKWHKNKDVFVGYPEL